MLSVDCEGGHHLSDGGSGHAGRDIGSLAVLVDHVDLGRDVVALWQKVVALSASIQVSDVDRVEDAVVSLQLVRGAVDGELDGEAEDDAVHGARRIGVAGAVDAGPLDAHDGLQHADGGVVASSSADVLF